jgi:hypothetical protein
MRGSSGARRELRAEREPHVLNRGDPVLLELLGVEVRPDRLVADVHVDVFVDSDQAIELRSDLGHLGDFDHERGRERIVVGDELVVNVDLLLDLLRLHDLLGPDHLLDVEEDRVAVLEHEHEFVADRDSSRALECDDPRHPGVAVALVGDVVLEILETDGPHGSSSSP